MAYIDELQNKFESNQFKVYPEINENTTLRLEFTNICNHQCIFCVNEKLERKRIHMEDPLIYRIIKEAAELGIKKAGYFMNGEPFVSKNLADYIKFSKDVGMEYVFITTNAGLADKEKLAKVFDAGLDSIKFSINGGSRETYKKVHGKDDYDKAMENLKFAYEYRKEKKLNYRILSSIVVTEYTINEIDEHYDKVTKFADEMVVFHANNFGGYLAEKMDELNVQVESNKIPQYEMDMNILLPCPLLFNSVNISCEGYLTLCSFDAMNYMAIEDLHNMSLKDAWYSSKMTELRKRHIAGDVNEIECFNCINNKQLKVEPLNKKLYLASKMGN